MRAIVQDYLEKPNPKLLAQMTTEEQNFALAQEVPAAKEKKAKKKEAAPVQEQAPEAPKE